MTIWVLGRRLGFSRRLCLRMCWEACRHDLDVLQRQVTDIKIRDYFLLQKQVGHTALLAAALHSACRVWREYKTLGIEEQVFWDTMGCFPRFMGETRTRFGEYRFDRGWWTWRQLEMKLFRLGQLEYELRENGEVAVHIPSDADLSPAQVDASLALAGEFLARFYPRWAAAEFTCHSWLLSPRLLPFLREDSNIRAFQQRFSILETDPDETCLQWLFAAKPDADLQTLPEDTSLRRGVKAHLLSGGLIGQGRGVLR